MRIGLLGDTHFSNSRPENRTDTDYLGTLLGKLDQALTICEEQGCEYVLQVGDWFNHWDVSNEVIISCIMLLKMHKIKVITIPGQHDISGHTMASWVRSPLKVLEAADAVQVPKPDVPIRLDDHVQGQRVLAWGAGFGWSMPERVATWGGNTFNILLVHKMITPEQLDPDSPTVPPEKFLFDHPGYDLIVCGDYHYAFDRHTLEQSRRVILNPGAMVRKTISLRDLALQPSVVIFDTETRLYEWVQLSVAPVERAFSLTTPPQKTDSAELDQFVASVRERRNMEAPQWKHILQQTIMEKVQPALQQAVSKAIDECISEVERDVDPAAASDT